MSDTKVQKWGNSLAMRIPAPLLRAWGVVEGQPVALSVEAGALVARPLRKVYRLDDLLAQCDFSQPLTAAERAWIDAGPTGLEEI